MINNKSSLNHENLIQNQEQVFLKKENQRDGDLSNVQFSCYLNEIENVLKEIERQKQEQKHS